MTDTELREKVTLILLKYHEAEPHAYFEAGEIMQLFTAAKEEAVREARTDERDFAWHLINDIRYQNVTLDSAKRTTLERLSDLQAEQDLAHLTKEEGKS